MRGFLRGDTRKRPPGGGAMAASSGVKRRGHIGVWMDH